MHERTNERRTNEPANESTNKINNALVHTQYTSKSSSSSSCVCECSVFSSFGVFGNGWMVWVGIHMKTKTCFDFVCWTLRWPGGEWVVLLKHSRKSRRKSKVNDEHEDEHRKNPIRKEKQKSFVWCLGFYVEFSRNVKIDKKSKLICCNRSGDICTQTTITCTFKQWWWFGENRKPLAAHKR